MYINLAYARMVYIYIINFINERYKMQHSIRQIFFNLKAALLFLGVSVLFLTIQLINISEYSERLAALKNQHIIIKKITTTKLDDPQMASITINGALAELELYVKTSNQDAIFDLFISITDEEKALYESLLSTSNSFQESALFWSESMKESHSAMYDRMIAARELYLSDINEMIDYQIRLIDQSVVIAKMTTLVAFIFILFVFFFYRWRLNQIYRDIKGACSVDLEGNRTAVLTEEIDFIVRRLARKSPIITNTTFLSTISGINNEKGMISAYNAKRNQKNIGSLFLAVFEIDQHDKLIASLNKDDLISMYKKIADILSMYEQPLDVIGHLENNSFAFLLARNSKDVALSETEKIVASINDSVFVTNEGNIKITVSAGFTLKAPAKSLEESLQTVSKIVQKAKEAGGNRVAQLRDGLDSYH